MKDPSVKANSNSSFLRESLFLSLIEVSAWVCRLAFSDNSRVNCSFLLAKETSSCSILCCKPLTDCLTPGNSLISSSNSMTRWFNDLILSSFNSKTTFSDSTSHWADLNFSFNSLTLLDLSCLMQDSKSRILSSSRWMSFWRFSITLSFSSIWSKSSRYLSSWDFTSKECLSCNNLISMACMSSNWSFSLTCLFWSAWISFFHRSTSSKRSDSLTLKSCTKSWYALSLTWIKFCKLLMFFIAISSLHRRIGLEKADNCSVKYRIMIPIPETTWIEWAILLCPSSSLFDCVASFCRQKSSSFWRDKTVGLLEVTAVVTVKAGVTSEGRWRRTGRDDEGAEKVAEEAFAPVPVVVDVDDDFEPGVDDVFVVEAEGPRRRVFVIVLLLIPDFKLLFAVTEEDGVETGVLLEDDDEGVTGGFREEDAFECVRLLPPKGVLPKLGLTKD